jgi:DNA polymerase-3 subunit beta
MSAKGKYVVHGGFYIKVGELKSALERFKRVIPERGTDKILRHLLMHQMHHRLELHGSDGEMYAIVALDVKPIEGMGLDVALAVPYKSLINHLKRIPDDVLLKCAFVDEHGSPSHILIESEYGRKTFHGMPFQRYPRAARFRCPNIAIMKVGDFRDMLSQTVFAADEHTGSGLNGVYFHCLPDKTRFVATNKYILSMYERADVVFTKPESVVVPTRVLQVFAEGIEDASEEEDVLIYVCSGHILLAYKGFSLFSKCLGGDFPDYESVISKERPYVVSLKREKLINEMKELLPFADKESPIFHLNFIGHRLDISVENTRRRMRKSKTGSVYYESVERTAFAVSFNAKQLLRILENIRSEYIEIKVATSSRPVAILPEPQDAKAYVLCLISPVIRYF